MKRPLVCLLCSLAAASAEERIPNGSFTGQAAGTVPQKPWIVPSQVTGGEDVSVTLQPLPGQGEGKLWVKFADGNAKLPTGVVTNFAEIKDGRLSAKVYFERVGSAFGIYLGAPKVSAPESRIIDFKVLKGGKLSLGTDGVRNKTSFAFEPGKVYPLFFDFKTDPEGKKVSYQVGLEDTGEILGSAEVDARAPIAGLRIATDSADDQSIVYVSDISLAEKP
jgi:hypothetical protein